MSREFRPAVGSPASPDFGERSGEKVDLHIGHVEGRPLVVPLRRRHRIPRRAARPRGDRARRARGARGRAAGRRPGPDHQPARVDVGDPALLLVRRDRGRLVVRGAGLRPRRRRALGGDRAQGRARRADALAAAADHGPRAARALLQHAAHLQAALADVDGRVGADRVRRPRRGGGRRRPARAPRARRRRSARPTRSSAATSAPTRACCSPRPPCRCGAARGCSSARSSSRPRPRPAPPPRG